MAERSKDSEKGGSSPSSSDTESLARGQWGRQVELTLSCVGYTVGFGNLWRFPYVCMVNGGGAFLIPYIFAVFVLGLPLYFLELILGQFTSLNGVRIWKMCPILKGVGWTSFISTATYGLYVNIIIMWVLYYLGSSFAKDVPWKTCDNAWNTPDCVDNMGHHVNTTLSVLNNSLTEGLQPAGNYSALANGGKNATATEEFWRYKVLDISDGIDDLGNIRWDRFLCLLASWFLIFICLIKGIRSMGKVVYVTATIPYLFLTILFIRALTLPGSLDGMRYFAVPDWSKLMEIQVWKSAFLQVFFSLGPGWGTITSLASYSRFENNCLRDAVVVCFTCCFTSLFAGVVTFSVFGFMAHDSGLKFEDVVTQGPGLVFIAYPEAVARLPLSPLWAVTFFIMLLIVGFSTQLANTETVASILQDEFGIFRNRRILLRALVCASLFLGGLIMITQAGVFILQVIDWYTFIFGILVVCLFECLVVCYVYGIGRFYRDMAWMMKKRLSLYWVMTWGLMIPLLLFSVLVYSSLEMSAPTSDDTTYPDWISTVGWILALAPLLAIPIFAVKALIQAKGSFSERLAKTMQPTEDWGPSDDKLLEDYKYSSRKQPWQQRMKLIGAYEWEERHESHDAEKVALNTVVVNGDYPHHHHHHHNSPEKQALTADNLYPTIDNPIS